MSVQEQLQTLWDGVNNLCAEFGYKPAAMARSQITPAKAAIPAASAARARGRPAAASGAAPRPRGRPRREAAATTPPPMSPTAQKNCEEIRNCMMGLPNQQATYAELRTGLGWSASKANAALPAAMTYGVISKSGDTYTLVQQQRRAA